MSQDAEQIISIYHQYAELWDGDRGRSLFEKPWLDRFLALSPPGGSVLDVGCGTGEPIARYVIGRGHAVTGVDSSSAMISLCRSRFPGQDWLVADMRKLALDRRFDGLLAWDSFFHLTHEAQRLMFPIFRAHAAEGAALLFTSGPRFGEAMGEYRGHPLYHASLDPAEYRALLAANGFEVVAHAAEDPECGGHTLWLARRAT